MIEIKNSQLLFKEVKFSDLLIATRFDPILVGKMRLRATSNGRGEKKELEQDL